MPDYHGPNRGPSALTSVKPSDVRDDWRRQVAGDAELGAQALRVALVLENYARGATGRTTVGLGRLAADLGMGRRVVERGIRELEKRGHVIRERGKGEKGRGGTTSVTWLLVREVPATVVGTVQKDTVENDESTGRGGRESTGYGGRVNPSLTLNPGDASRANERARAAELSDVLLDWVARGFSEEAIKRGRPTVTAEEIAAARAEVSRQRAATAQRPLPLLSTLKAPRRR